MTHPLTHPVHSFHIPVMGTGFTVDTPLKVARYGISSVVSLVDDILLEQMRGLVCRREGRGFEAVPSDAEDARADRITRYLDLLAEVVDRQIEQVRGAVFETGSEITRYFEMLPGSPLRAAYERMLEATGPARARLQEELRGAVVAGGIDVNIMTKLDRVRLRHGLPLGPAFTDAMSALRGYARSRLRSSVVLSAGVNRRLFAYLAEFDDFFPDRGGDFRKRIVLKVSDFRSAQVQARLLAQKGLWVSEFRVESGLNCGGHAFGGTGTLLGPVLEDFRRERARLSAQLRESWASALASLGRAVPATSPEQRVTVQGGIGTAEENELLLRHYGVDGTGWGTPFLMVPEAVNIDPIHLDRLCKAGEDDIHLSDSSPLGVPFWSLRNSESELLRLQRIDDGHPGSACPKGFLVSNTEFTKVPICTASRAYQRRKLQDIDDAGLDAATRAQQTDDVVVKACICHDLAGGATLPSGIDPDARTAVCCGPNAAYFTRSASLREMIDHIYGRGRLPLAEQRPHMLLKELSLHLDRLREAASDRQDQGAEAAMRVRENLLAGIEHYRELAAQALAGARASFLERLEYLQSELTAHKS
ncbi:MAG: hypothetical protein Q7W56_04610 [Candidatus Latescibacteria bacterium]|nr:hypothetical protein [Candidatus Latescibacterota bacterium]